MHDRPSCLDNTVIEYSVDRQVFEIASTALLNIRTRKGTTVFRTYSLIELHKQGFRTVQYREHKHALHELARARVHALSSTPLLLFLLARLETSRVRENTNQRLFFQPFSFLRISKTARLTKNS